MIAPARLFILASANAPLMKPKDIFGLAVRFLGLVFLYFGLKAVTQMLDLDVLESPDRNEIINDLMPIVFNLAIALWLLRGGFVRWAYPEEAQKKSERSLIEAKPATPSPASASSPASAASPELSGMARAEEKLASLVEKPKGGQGG